MACLAAKVSRLATPYRYIVVRARESSGREAPEQTATGCAGASLMIEYTIDLGVSVSRRVSLPIVLAFFGLPSAHGVDASAALQDALAALQRRDFPTAELKLRTELKLHPNDAETLSLLGVALDNQKKFTEADSIHRRAIAADPASARALGNYGNHRLLTGDEKGAREAFQKAVAADPADIYSNLQLAQLALKGKASGRAKEALDYLDHLPVDQREAPAVAVLRLAALDLGGDREEADAVFARLSAATSTDATLSASLGWTLTETGHYERP